MDLGVEWVGRQVRDEGGEGKLWSEKYCTKTTFLNKKGRDPACSFWTYEMGQRRNSSWLMQSHWHAQNEQTQTLTYLDPVRIVVKEEDSRACHLLRFYHRLQISQQVHVLWHVCRKYLAGQRLFHEGRRPKGETKLPMDREVILSLKRKRETLNSDDVWKWVHLGELFSSWLSSFPRAQKTHTTQRPKVPGHHFQGKYTIVFPVLVLN